MIEDYSKWDSRSRAEICYSCKEEINVKSESYSLSIGYRGFDLDRRFVFFHKECWLDIAGEEYCFLEKKVK